MTERIAWVNSSQLSGGQALGAAPCWACFLFFNQQCPATVFDAYWPRRSASASSARWPLGPPRAPDAPVVPEPGAAAVSGWRPQFWPAAFACSRRLTGTAARSWASRHESRRCCSRSSGRCCSGSRSASCSRCCSSCHRGSRGSRTFFGPGARLGVQPERTARRKPQLCACSACATHARTDRVTSDIGTRPRFATRRSFR